MKPQAQTRYFSAEVWLALLLREGFQAGGHILIAWIGMSLMALVCIHSPFVRVVPFSAGLLPAVALAPRLFDYERQSGGIELLLNMPVRPFDIAAGKFVTLYFIDLLMLFIPVLLAFDLKITLLSLGITLLLSTIFMAPSLVFEQWRDAYTYLPLFAGVMFIALRTNDAKANLAMKGWVNSHWLPLSLLSMALTPAIAILSSIIFSNRHRPH